MKRSIFLLIIIILNGLIVYPQRSTKQNIYIRNFKETITPIELNHGEIVKYTKKDGKVLTIELLATSANILYTNRDKIPFTESGNDLGSMARARLMYEFKCEVNINGLHMTMQRYVCSQESFYEPYVIDGVRIWFDGVTDIFEEHKGFLDRVRDANGKPGKNARFVLQDMNHRICPGKIYPWFIDGDERDDNFIYKANYIDVGRTYDGDDCFLGAYYGGQAHGALDICMAQNSLMYAPFDLDTQAGIRAEGSKTWPDGSQWRINTGHVIEKYVPDNTPVKGGEVYGRGARRATGTHAHAHFAFQIYEQGILYDIDPWIIFWQLFEDNKKKDGELRAMMEALDHSKTGVKVKFRSTSILNGNHCSDLEYYWTFGDGGSATGSDAEHIFHKPGIFPVTLTIQNGNELASFTQHITIEGTVINNSQIVLSSDDEPSFRKRPVQAMDVYGWPVKIIPNTMKFLARPSRPVPHLKRLIITNPGSGELAPVTYGIDYRKDQVFGWLKITSQGEGNNQMLDIGVDAKGVPPGKYAAIVSVHSPGALNSPQKFRVEMNIPKTPAKSPGVIIDDKDDEFYCTPYFWIGHRFHGWGWPELKEAEGYNHFYLVNGQRNAKGEFARFTPDLEAGIYDVWLYERTPFSSGPPANNEPAGFNVRIVHAEGDTTIWMEPKITEGFFPRPIKDPEGWSWINPQPSRKIGTYKFEEGNDGFIEILADGSYGQVIVDAVRFLKRDPSTTQITRPEEIAKVISGLNILPDEVIDGDGNSYRAIKIGNQVWISENLRTTRYNDGNSIPMVADSAVWADMTTPAFCWYDNDEAKYKNIYGALYNWYSVNTNKLCPGGWHVPSDKEWAELIDYLGGANLAANKTGETGKVHWLNQTDRATNETGFTALPGGNRFSDSRFKFIGVNGNWWSSSESSSTHAWARSMTYNSNNLYRRSYFKRYGYSVRCIKD